MKHFKNAIVNVSMLLGLLVVLAGCGDNNPLGIEGEHKRDDQNPEPVRYGSITVEVDGEAYTLKNARVEYMNGAFSVLAGNEVDPREGYLGLMSLPGLAANTTYKTGGVFIIGEGEGASAYATDETHTGVIVVDRVTTGRVTGYIEVRLVGHPDLANGGKSVTLSCARFDLPRVESTSAE